jgi:isoquinoline 1-oxidoreductase subunit alpha
MNEVYCRRLKRPAKGRKTVINLSINGKPVTLDVDPQTPLLWILRDELSLRGTKYGCGKGLCGACTVHLNGKAMRSCLLPVSQAVDADVRTIEGLSADGNHPVQVAWRDLNVPQCGYCQSGQIMSASALLADNPAPTDDEIDTAMSGNICRCGTYPRIRAAVKQVASEGGAA